MASNPKLSLRIVIVGAGIGGLATALAVHEAGHTAVVLEQASDFVEIGAGVQVPPNASRELIRWGLRTQMESIASHPRRINYRHWKTGQPEGHTDITEIERQAGAPYWQVYRPDYHQVLLNAAIQRGVEVRKGQAVTEYRPWEPSVVLAGGEIVSGDLVVAADGIKSLARRDILGTTLEPHETGDTCFRAVIPRDKLLADPELAPLALDPCFEQFLGPHHHIIGYNIQAGQSFNLLVVIPDDSTMHGYKAPSTSKQVLEAYSGWSPMVQKLLALLPESLERWRLIDLPVISNWVHPSNKMLILGDAVHATLPYLAQGAAMAVEDAAVLGVSLTHLRSKEEIANRLRSFYQLRAPRAHAVQRGSYTNRFFIHMASGPELAMRQNVFAAGSYPGSPNLLGDTLFHKWLYEYDAYEDARRSFRAEGPSL